MNAEYITDKITTAFSEVKLGRGIGLLEAQAIDDYESEEVQKKYREKDEKDNWQLLRAKELQQCHSSLSFFDADGMRFHLPAFIIASIKDDIDDPLFHLIGVNDLSEHQKKSLNTEQRKAVITYLKWCLTQDIYDFEHPTIKRALKEYWEK